MTTQTKQLREDYSGDLSLEYGGVYIDVSNARYGYADAVRVTDLDSACGFTGAVLIERISINGLTERKRLREVMKCCGWMSRREFPRGRDNRDTRLRMYAEALMSYGYCDPVNSFDGPSREVIQCDRTAPMSYDGWKADFRLADGSDLRGYVESAWIDW